MSKLPDSLNSLLSELERFGEDNDLGNTKRESKMLNITRDTGEFLAALIRATGARHILEVGAPTATPPCGWPLPPSRSAVTSPRWNAPPSRWPWHGRTTSGPGCRD
nr:hypothetical protein [Verrucomicrobium spinosum]